MPRDEASGKLCGPFSDRSGGEVSGADAGHQKRLHSVPSDVGPSLSEAAAEAAVLELRAQSHLAEGVVRPASEDAFHDPFEDVHPVGEEKQDPVELSSLAEAERDLPDLAADSFRRGRGAEDGSELSMLRGDQDLHPGNLPFD